MQQLKSEGKKAFIPYVTFGYPSIAKFEKIILALDEAGVTAIEVGLPFSDPIADGPVIQMTSALALKNGVNLEVFCECLTRLKKKIKAPLILMTYYNLLFGTGLKKFVEMTKGTIDGYVIPDILPEAAEELSVLAEKADIDMTFFIAPTTQKKRISVVDKSSTGFIYYVSITGTTGTKVSFDKSVYKDIASVNKKTNSPVCVGFGISSPDHVVAFNKVADGVIVGSAIIKKIIEYKNDKNMPKRIKEFVLWLMNG